MRICESDSESWVVERIKSIYISPWPIKGLIHFTIVFSEIESGELQYSVAPEFDIAKETLEKTRISVLGRDYILGRKT